MAARGRTAPRAGRVLLTASAAPTPQPQGKVSPARGGLILDLGLLDLAQGLGRLHATGADGRLVVPALDPLALFDSSAAEAELGGDEVRTTVGQLPKRFAIMGGELFFGVLGRVLVALQGSRLALGHFRPRLLDRQSALAALPGAEV